MCVSVHIADEELNSKAMKDTAAQLNILKSFAATALLGRV